MSENLYPGVFLAALIETVFPPIPSEAVFPLAGYVILNQEMPVFHVFGVGVAGGAGATVGAFVIYLIAKKVGRYAIVKYAKKVRVSEKQIIRAESWFSKYGDKAVLFGRMIPGIRELVSIPAGIFSMKPKKFLIFTFIGSCSWSILLTIVGYSFGIATIEIF